MKKYLSIFLIICFIFCCGFCATEQNEKQIKLPVVMYHSILNSKTGTYIVSQQQLEQDLSQIISSGYTTVFPSQVIDFVYNNAPLPEKPILITFDDGYYNNLYYGLEIFEKFKAKANLNVISSLAEDEQSKVSNPNYSYLKWEQIRTMAESGHFEIGNHSYDMHKYSPRYGIDQMGCEKDEDYYKALNIDIDLSNKLLKQKANITTNVFAFPFGQYNDLALSVLRQREYKMFLTCYEKINIITQGDRDCLYNIGRINRSGSISTATLIEKIKSYS